MKLDWLLKIKFDGFNASITLFDENGNFFSGSPKIESRLYLDYR